MLDRLLADPTLYPMQLKTWLISWLEGSDLTLPMSSINGLKVRLDALTPAALELAYVESDVPVNVGSGASVVVLSTNITVTNESKILVTVGLPNLELASASGGDAVVLLSVGSPPVEWPLGRVTADRSLGWPEHLTRKADVTITGTVQVDLIVRSISGALVVHAGEGYGMINLRILGG